MMRRLLLGPPGKEDFGRLGLRLILAVVWIILSAVEGILTSRDPQTKILSSFWAVMLIIAVFWGSWAFRILWEERRRQGRKGRRS
jgi:hypothetical protein